MFKHKKDASQKDKTSQKVTPASVAKINSGRNALQSADIPKQKVNTGQIAGVGSQAGGSGSGSKWLQDVESGRRFRLIKRNKDGMLTRSIKQIVAHLERTYPSTVGSFGWRDDAASPSTKPTGAVDIDRHPSKREQVAGRPGVGTPLPTGQKNQRRYDLQFDEKIICLLQQALCLNNGTILMENQLFLIHLSSRSIPSRNQRRHMRVEASGK